jgi:hypothetical protein
LNAKKEAAKRRNAPAPAPVAASSAPSFSSSSDDEDQPEAAPYQEALQPMQRVYLAALNVVPNRELDPTLDQPPIAVAGAHAPAPAPSAAVASVNSAVKTLKDSAKAKYLTATVFEQGRKVFVPPAIGGNSGKGYVGVIESFNKSTRKYVVFRDLGSGMTSSECEVQASVLALLSVHEKADVAPPNSIAFSTSVKCTTRDQWNLQCGITYGMVDCVAVDFKNEPVWYNVWMEDETNSWFPVTDVVPGLPPASPPRARAKKSLTVRPAKKSLTADFNSDAAVVVPKIKLRHVLKSAKHNWMIKKVDRDGHCFFRSIVKGMIDHRIPSCPKTPEELRAACADQILAWNGVIPGRPNAPMIEKNGKIRVQQARGAPEKFYTLEQYCNLVSSSLYGGFDEMFVIVQMYKLQIFVYSDDCYRGGDPEPQKILLDCNLTEDAEENAGETNISVLSQLLITRSLFSSHLLLGPRIHLLLEKGKTGYSDHTSLMIHKHHHYYQMMSHLLDVDVDYRVCDDGKCGRGLEGMRRVEIGQFIERYDGHHVDSEGKVVFRMESVSALMREYPQIDRERNNTPFQKTHAVRVGRRHESGLMVDGGPLTHPCLDHVKGVGRMALANSGSPKTSNMYVL